MPFSDYRDNFDPETLAILEIAFNEAWEVYGQAVAPSTRWRQEMPSPN